MTALIMPIVILLIISYGLAKKVPVFDCFINGAKDGLKTMYSIAPSLIGLITAVGMFKSSGALDMITDIIRPIMEKIGVPTEIAPLFLLKPISGSGSLALLDRIVKDSGANSLTSKIAAVITGSTETTFYCIAVYYGAVNVKNTGYTIPCALIGDFAGMAAACFTVMHSSFG